jgi:hypothetical protein
MISGALEQTNRSRYLSLWCCDSHHAVLATWFFLPKYKTDGLRYQGSQRVKILNIARSNVSQVSQKSGRKRCSLSRKIKTTDKRADDELLLCSALAGMVYDS